MMHKAFLSAVTSVLLCTQVACSPDAGIAPTVISPDSLYWSLQINYPSIRLSLATPHNTVRVNALPYNVLGSQLQLDSDQREQTTTWSSSDSTLVRVDHSGLISARGVTGTKKVYVTAVTQIGDITKQDRALVQVINTIDPEDIVSFQTRPADSLKRAVGGSFIMRPVVMDSDGDTVRGLPIHYRSSNPIAGRITDAWSGTIFAGTALVAFSNSIGTSRITASTWVYGKGLIDTFTIEVGWPLSHPFYIPMPDYKVINGVPTAYLLYPKVEIGPGGVVGFANGTAINGAKVARLPGLQLSNGKAVSFIFDDSTNVKSAGPGFSPTADGNVHNIVADTLIHFLILRQFRKFNVPGEYKYTVEPFGLRGVVVVHDR